jgi:hypothetical protein
MSHLVFRQKLLGEDGSVRQVAVMVKQSGLFLPKFRATSLHVFMQSPQNFAVEPGIHSLAYWDKFLALPQLLYRWQHQSGIFWIPPHISTILSTMNYYKGYPPKTSKQGSVAKSKQVTSTIPHKPEIIWGLWP